MGVKATGQISLATMGNTPSGGFSNVYSMEEVAVGTWIDGKTIYRKVVDFGTLPNNTSKKASVDLSAVEQYIDIRAIAQNAAKTAQPISYASPSNLSNAISITANTGDNTITIVTGLNKTSYYAYVILEYTKTTE